MEIATSVRILRTTLDGEILLGDRSRVRERERSPRGAREQRPSASFSSHCLLLRRRLERRECVSSVPMRRRYHRVLCAKLTLTIGAPDWRKREKHGTGKRPAAITQPSPFVRIIIATLSLCSRHLCRVSSPRAPKHRRVINESHLLPCAKTISFVRPARPPAAGVYHLEDVSRERATRRSAGCTKLILISTLRDHVGIRF